MEKKELKTAAWCAAIMGISYVIIVICAFLSPRSIASYVTSAQYFSDFRGYEWIFIFLKSVMALANAAFIGVVIAFFRLNKTSGILPLFSLLAVIGAGIGMYQSVVDATTVPHLAQRYDTASPILQHVIIAFGVANPGIYALSLGLPALWFLVVNALFFRYPSYPKILALLGFLWGIGSLITIFAHMFVWIWLIYLVAFGAGVAAPLWAIWQARFFLKLAHKGSSQ